jgi:hypothetical protein
MTTELTIANGGGALTDALALGRFQDVVRRLYGAIERERGTDVLPALPSPELRKVMRERQLALRSVLRPISMATGEQKRARDAIAALLGAYLNIRTDNPSAVAAGYVAHLAEQPLFAILQACDDFKHRRVVDHIREDGTTVYFTLDHAPSAFRLLDQVKRCAADAQVESYQIVRLLAITKVKPAEVAADPRVGELLRGLADRMIAGSNVIREAELAKSRAEAQAARDRAARIIQDARRRNAELDAASQEQAAG